MDEEIIAEIQTSTIQQELLPRMKMFISALYKMQPCPHVATEHLQCGPMTEEPIFNIPSF